MKRLLLTLAFIPTLTVGQSMYKCPNANGSMTFQQMPCSLQGGGEVVPMKSIPSGAGSGISENAKEYMADRDKYWSDKAKAQAEENARQEALGIERAKVRAAYRAAAAQEATASAIRQAAQSRPATRRR